MSPSLNPVPQTLSAEQWEQLIPLFSAVIELALGDREVFLVGQSALSPSLIAELRRLLAQHDQASSFLSSPLLAPTKQSLPPSLHSVFTPGQMLVQRFHIKRFLGAGGMGEVYEARDTTLNETIAIKTLKPALLAEPTMLDRFAAEVQRSRRVVHRSVCRVHDLFFDIRPGSAPIPFFTMQLLQGQTLAEFLRDHGPIAEPQALLWLANIADALDASHHEGLIHRDLKPGNIFLIKETHFTRAVVTDFGLATPTCSISEIRDLDSSAADSLFAAGTPAYMAPEQIESQPLSPQTDIYALALVAAEMRSGLPVFAFQSPLLCAIRKLSALDPISPLQEATLSARWSKAIRRALNRHPASRFPSASAFLNALQPLPLLDRLLPPKSLSRRAAFTSSVGAPVLAALTLWNRSRSTLPSIAILPFLNDTGNPYLDYFSDGVAEELTQSLSSFPGLRVVARNSAFRFRSSTEPIKMIAQSLTADSIVSGSVRRIGSRVRVSVQLINAPSGKILWSEIYDRDLSQILIIQSEIHNQIAAALRLQPPAASPRSQQTSNIEAYDQYLQARRLWNSRTKEGLTAALSGFQQAVSLDPSYSAAYVGIADSHTVMIDYGLVPTLAALPPSKDALQKAVSIDANLAEAYAALGLSNCIAQWDHPAAERAFLRALSLKPSLLNAHHWYGGFLMRAGRLDEALTQARQARQLDPLSLPTIVFEGWVHHYRREFSQAISIGDQATGLDPKFPHGFQLKALAFASQGKHSQALSNSDRAVALISDTAVALRFRALALSVLPGLEVEAREAASSLAALSNDRQAAYLAIIYAGLRDPENMYRWIDRALQIRDSAILFINIDRATIPYRNQHRFEAALRTIGYTPSSSRASD